MTRGDQPSSPLPELFASEAEKMKKEAANGLLLFDEVERLFHESAGILKLKPEAILQLQRTAIQGIYICAGRYRTVRVRIRGARHEPPAPAYVPSLVEEMCEKANNSNDWDPIETAAYLLWRLSWIHPFRGGNGRTARALSYLGLSVKLGFLPPGKNTIPEQILQSRAAFFEALADADSAWEMGVLGLEKMKSLLDEMLQKQLST